MALNAHEKARRLRSNVGAAFKVFCYSVQLRETLAPAAFDKGLHERMSYCFSGKAFEIIRLALRRELILSLAKLWDRDDDLVRMDRVAEFLRKPSVIQEIAIQNAVRFPTLPSADIVAEKAGKEAIEALKILDRYLDGGSHRHIHDNLRRIRNEELAHHHLSRDLSKVPEISHTEVEECYSDMARLFPIILSIVENTSVELEEFCRITRSYSEKFWAGVVSELDERHPHYRAPYKPISPLPPTLPDSKS